MISGKEACEMASAGVGATYMAVASGVTGGTLTLPAILAGGAFGYLLGKIVCKIPAIQKLFNEALGTGDWDKLEISLSDSAIRSQAVAVISSEVGVSSAQAETVWDALINAVKLSPKEITQSASFKAATYHPATGSAKHGISVINTRFTNMA